jgi:hypothetical protein
VRSSPGEAYEEFNFAPSTQWAAYRFDGYRRGMRVANEIAAPRITVQSAPERFTLAATLEFDPGRARCQLGLTAVLEEAGGGVSYWALAHSPGKPDFHHADGFVGELNP